jgi:hypothetical protein
MNEFYRAITHVNKIVYEPNHLTLKSIQEENQIQITALEHFN